MTAYMIVDLDVHDPATYQDYREKAPAFVAKHGGRYLARGGDFEVIEGDWKPHRLVIFQFPNREAIRNLFADPEYRKVAEIRFRSAKTIVVAVDGIE